MQAVEIWNKVNESVQIIRWPGVVVVVIIVFHVQLKELFQRVRELVTPAGSVKLDPSEQAAANLEIAVSAGTLMESVTAARASLPDSEDAESEQGKPAPDMRELKDEVEGVIRSSYVAGFRSATAVAASGKDLQKYVVPQPVIEWAGSAPRVIGYKPYVFADAVLPNVVLDNVSDGLTSRLALDREMHSARIQMVQSRIGELGDAIRDLDLKIEHASGDPVVAETLRERQKQVKSELEIWTEERKRLRFEGTLLRRMGRAKTE